jgi:hypothetical protein
MKRLIVKDRKLDKKLEDRLIKKGLVVALCEGGSYTGQKRLKKLRV